MHLETFLKTIETKSHRIVDLQAFLLQDTPNHFPHQIVTISIDA